MDEELDSQISDIENELDAKESPSETEAEARDLLREVRNAEIVNVLRDRAFSNPNAPHSISAKMQLLVQKLAAQNPALAEKFNALCHGLSRMGI